MFIARVPNRKSPPAILLRESYREHGKVKTCTLANLSNLPESAIETLKRSLKSERQAARCILNLPGLVIVVRLYVQSIRYSTLV